MPAPAMTTIFLHLFVSINLATSSSDLHVPPLAELLFLMGAELLLDALKSKQNRNRMCVKQIPFQVPCYP